MTTAASIPPAPHKLTVRGLHKTFGDLVALDHVSLDVDDGEFISLVGPSGCGKTTLLRIIAGLEHADAGDVAIDAVPVTRPGTDRGFVFQADCLMPWRTVWRNAYFGIEISGRDSEEARERTRRLLRLVGLDGFERYYPWQLSGGMRQRANLARALAINPQVLLMDEPFSALDAQTREIMQTELLRIWETGRKTVLFITHQIDEAVYLSDRVVVLGRRPGRIREIVPIDLPRPRALGVKRTPAFAAYVDRIWGMIERDVRDSLSEERVLGH
jgi:NitT/TauT family transport system ATP-binding protein